jgi:hypothetical protein
MPPKKGEKESPKKRAKMEEEEEEIEIETEDMYLNPFVRQVFDDYRKDKEDARKDKEFLQKMLQECLEDKKRLRERQEALEFAYQTVINRPPPQEFVDSHSTEDFGHIYTAFQKEFQVALDKKAGKK